MERKILQNRQKAQFDQIKIKKTEKKQKKEMSRKLEKKRKKTEKFMNETAPEK